MVFSSVGEQFEFSGLSEALMNNTSLQRLGFSGRCQRYGSWGAKINSITQMLDVNQSLVFLGITKVRIDYQDTVDLCRVLLGNGTLQELRVHVSTDEACREVEGLINCSRVLRNLLVCGPTNFESLIAAM